MPSSYDSDWSSDDHWKKPDLDATLEALKTNDPDGMLSSTLYYGLSRLTVDEAAAIKPVWDDLRADHRRKILTEVAEASEFNFELDYRELGFLSLNDPDAGVRQSAIDVLWEDESSELMWRLIDLAEWDEAPEVRAAAASALGRFILLGEYGELSEQEAARAQDTVINLLNDESEDMLVRRRALEAIANSSHEIVEGAIREAYQSDDRMMRVSAVFAMGRSCDARWQPHVLREMGSPDPELRYEAARAAGELELQEAVPGLGRLAVQDDREIKEVAIWSLGEIGGRAAMRILGALAEDATDAGDEDLLEAIEDAIANASLAGHDLEFSLEDDD